MRGIRSARSRLPAAVSPGGADLSTWLRDRFIPCWAERVIRPGLAGYVEEFRWHDGAPCEVTDHTTMVTGRLVYAFSMAYRFDRRPQLLRAAEHGLKFLLDACCLSPGQFAHSVGRSGEVIDPHGDLYDLAFVLLALGGYSAATGRVDVLAVAHAIAGRLDGELTDPWGAYREPWSTGGVRLIYPQMHLFEAFQMLATVDPAGGWDLRAARILDLLSRLVDTQGGLDEEFGAGWDSLQPERRRREVGHHFEWAWLLFVYTTATGSVRARDLAWRLFDYGRATAGIAETLPDRPIPNAIDAQGKPLPINRPLWPTLELAKASLAAATVGEAAELFALSHAAIDIFISRINLHALTWENDDGKDCKNGNLTVPARTLYHILPCLLLCACGSDALCSRTLISITNPF